MTADDLAHEQDRPSLAGTLAALPEPWTLLRERRIGDDTAEPVDVVLVHPGIGIALVDEAPRDPGAAVANLRAYLDQQRFAEFFPGDLPIVALSVAAEDLPAVGERLAAAFEAEKRLAIADRDWADGVIELLLVPDDLAMAPIAAAETAEPPEPPRRPVVPPPRPDWDRPPPPQHDSIWGQPRRDEEFPLVLDHAAPRDGDAYGEPLMTDWPMLASYEARRWRWRAAFAALALLLLGGLGIAAWQFNSDDTTSPVTAALSPSDRIELALPNQAQDKPAQDNAAPQAQEPADNTPPPLPAAPPVTMAAKPLASPPPPAPVPTRVAPLPQMAANKPPATPAPSAKPEPQPPAAGAVADATPSPPAKPPQTAGADANAPMAAPPPEKPKPPRVAKANPPPRREPPANRTRPPQETPKPPQQVASNPPPQDEPAIDAAQLPPLPSSARSQDQPRGDVGAPPSLGPPPRGDSAGQEAALGPPIPLRRAAANATVNNAPTVRECRPYTSDTTLTGRGSAVQGIACRGNDGQWRLVSEVPVR